MGYEEAQVAASWRAGEQSGQGPAGNRAAGRDSVCQARSLSFIPKELGSH